MMGGLMQLVAFGAQDYYINASRSSVRKSKFSYSQIIDQVNSYKNDNNHKSVIGPPSYFELLIPFNKGYYCLDCMKSLYYTPEEYPNWVNMVKYNGNSTATHCNKCRQKTRI